MHVLSDKVLLNPSVCHGQVVAHLVPQNKTCFTRHLARTHASVKIVMPRFPPASPVAFSDIHDEDETGGDEQQEPRATGDQGSVA